MIIYHESETWHPSINVFLKKGASNDDKEFFCQRHDISRGKLNKLLSGESIEVRENVISSVVELPTFVSDVDEIKKMVNKRNDDEIYGVEFLEEPDGIIVSKIGFEGDEKGMIPFVVNELKRRDPLDVLSNETVCRFLFKKL